MRRRIGTGTIIAFAVLLLVVLVMDIGLMFSQIRQRTKDAGVSRLQNTSRELEESIESGERLTMGIAIESREVLDDREALRKFLHNKKEQVATGESGAFNVYAAGSDWWIIPDFDSPPDYVAQERTWYKGAIRNAGAVYVSSPYQDAMTGDICYTVSVMLGDGKTVIAVDFAMDTIQSYVDQILDGGINRAAIVTDDGTIAGCSQKNLIGEQLTDVLPELAGVWSLSKSGDEVVSTRIQSDFLYNNLLAARAGNGWILIISVNDWELYQESYIQLIVTIVLLLAFVVTVTLVFLVSKRRQRREGEDALQRKRYHESRKRTAGGGVIRQYRNRILAFMIVVMLLSLYTIVSATYSWGNAQMQSEAEKYEHDLSRWIDKQKSILDMFVGTISSNPDMLKDYEGTVSYLDNITRQFPEISASYMSHPNLKPSVYMNNGWEPTANWVVEERPWWSGTLESKTGWCITAPYYDTRTGEYCVTICEQVHDAKTGEFLGVFGLDYYIDSLTAIMGNSYNSDGYAFLVDTEGYIINHPYGTYLISQDSKTSVLELPYGSVQADGKDTKLIWDYDGSLKVLLATVNDTSRFSIYIVSDARLIYGRVLIYGSTYLIAFLACIVAVYRLLSEMIAWQDEANRRLERAAQTDAMTGLLNKASAEEAISHAVKKGVGALMVVDLDNFKPVNDLYGHEMGDRVLIRFAELIQSAIRDGDIAGRIGGDEFAVFCEGLTDEKTIAKKCDFLNREIVASAEEYMGSDMGIPLGCSMGVTLVPKDGREYDMLFAKADLALHHAKRGSKHGVRIHQDQETERPEESKGDLSNLRMIFGERNPRKTALVAERELFQDIYQSMVRLASANGWNLHLVEFTLHREEPNSEEGISGCTDRFVELSAGLLRNSDIILKYNNSQVVFLLMEPENGDHMVPINRVLGAWERDGVPGITISYQQEQVND